MRDPIKRATSAFYYIRKQNSYKDHVFYPEVYLARSFQEYLSNVLTKKIQPSPEFSNHAVRLLNWGHNDKLDAMIWDDTAAVQKKDEFISVSEEDYRMAKANLDKMFFVGLTEEWDVSQQMLCRMLGIDCMKKVWKNSNFAKEEYPADTLPDDGSLDLLEFEHPPPSAEEAEMLNKLLK